MSRAGIAKKSAETSGKAGEVKRAQIPVRTTPASRERLMAAASANDRSLTQEIEQRLERSLALDDLRGGPETTRLVEAIASEIAHVEQWTGRGWSADMATYYAAREAVQAVMRRYHPPLLNADGVRRTHQAFKDAEAERDDLRAQLEAIAVIPAVSGLQRLQRIGMFAAAQRHSGAGASPQEGLGSALMRAAAPREPAGDAYEQDARRVELGEVKHPDGSDYTQGERIGIAQEIRRLRNLEANVTARLADWTEALEPQRQAEAEGMRIASERAAAAAMPSSENVHGA